MDQQTRRISLKCTHIRRHSSVELEQEVGQKMGDRGRTQVENCTNCQRSNPVPGRWASILEAMADFRPRNQIFGQSLGGASLVLDRHDSACTHFGG
jgi:hypothetical protein